MSRYTYDKEGWTYAASWLGGRVEMQSTTLTDTRNGAWKVYDRGAYRVLVDGKPCRVGKGGTVPFTGETAYYHAEALAIEMAYAHRHDQKETTS